MVLVTEEAVLAVLDERERLTTSPNTSLVVLVGVGVREEEDAVGVWLGEGRVGVESIVRSTDMGDDEGGGELEWARGVARRPEAKMDEYAPR